MSKYFNLRRDFCFLEHISKRSMVVIKILINVVKEGLTCVQFQGIYG